MIVILSMLTWNWSYDEEPSAIEILRFYFTQNKIRNIIRDYI